MKTGTLSLGKTTKPTARKSRTTNNKIKHKTGEQQTGISVAACANERHRMISEAAYFNAEKRGFQDGDETLDWLEAEKDVDSLLGEAANSVSG